ncbi:MAG TPA: PVC-type heme-binding CxxCH protein [Fibrobacteria bacterium]|nr:PVC-type heme-binding CxxCH protein [Fibrobacteria bacterium]
MNRITGITLSLLGALFSSVTAQPLTKTGPCPNLTRYNAPAGENWAQFPIKPNPSSDFPTNTIQNPLDPAQSINCIEVPSGLKAEVWASEKIASGLTPEIGYLQHFTFDEKGRMWAVEPRSYPNIFRNASGNINDDKFKGGTDRILILEDTNGDKVMDKVKVFRDGLNMPQGIEVVKGGVVVAMVPYLVFFPNENDVAGTPQILWNGLGGGNGGFDSHGGISSLMYGLDNWIYGHTGYNTCSAGGVDCGRGRVWRFRHTALGHARTEFQVWTTGPSNAWGIGQSEDGQIFQSGATGSPHINHSIRQGASSIDIRNGTGRELFYPITGDRFLWEGSTAKNGQGWFQSGTTAVSGLQLYTSRLLPSKYWNRFAFTCEGASKLCNQDSLVVNGSTWRAMRMPGPQRSNILASTDAWVAPILAKTGPDGAVWVLDWYNYLFLHNPASPMGMGGAWNNHLRAKSRYRIYRVTPADGSTEPVLNLANATVPTLVNTLSNPNLHWRLQAQRLLIERGYTEEMGALLKTILTTDRSMDVTGNNPQVVHALWTLHGLDRFTTDAATWDPILQDLLLHPAWGVRRNVLRVLPRTTASATAINTACSVNDTHGHVRLQALVAFSEISSKPAGLKAMYDTYKNVDSYATAAFTAAGISSSADKACEPTLHTVGISRQTAPAAAPRSDLRFTVLRGGFRLERHGRLPNGELTLHDAAGREVFRSAYLAREGRWTTPEARGLTAPVYGYIFRGADGSLMQGRLSLAGSL